MKHKYHSRKIRQLDHLIKEMKRAMRAHQPKALVDRIRAKITALINDLRDVLSTRQLTHKLGALAIVFGFASSANAQLFNAPVQNPFGFVNDSTSYAGGLVAADLDSDGDFDLLVGGYYGAFRYYENTGSSGSPSFSTGQVNPFGLNSVNEFNFMTAADLDDDGDLDILAGEYYGQYQYFENLGTASDPLFAAANTNPFGLAGSGYIALPHFVDLDDDGDYDILSGLTSAFAFIENVGDAANPSFAAPVNDPFGFVFSSQYFAYPTTADLDQDGDLDLLVSEYYGNFKYYENAGSATTPTFAGSQMNPFGLIGNIAENVFPKFVDIDDDGDYDILAHGEYGDVWFMENTQFNVGVDELTNNVSIGPNPFSNEVYFTENVQLNLVEVLDMTGKLVYSEVNPEGEISLEHLKKGVYLIQVVDSEGQISREKLEKL